MLLRSCFWPQQLSLAVSPALVKATCQSRTLVTLHVPTFRWKVWGNDTRGPPPGLSHLQLLDLSRNHLSDLGAPNFHGLEPLDAQASLAPGGRVRFEVGLKVQDGPPFKLCDNFCGQFTGCSHFVLTMRWRCTPSCLVRLFHLVQVVPFKPFWAQSEHKAGPRVIACSAPRRLNTLSLSQNDLRQLHVDVFQPMPGLQQAGRRFLKGRLGSAAGLKTTPGETLYQLETIWKFFKSMSDAESKTHDIVRVAPS